MESTEIFIFVLLIAAVATQKKNLPPSDSLPPADPGSANNGKSGGLMSKLFTWAQSVRPIQPPNQNIPSSKVGFPPDSLGSDVGFPPDSLGPDVGFPPESLGPEAGLPPDSLGPDAGFSQDSLSPSGGLPPEPATGSSDVNSLLSGGVLSIPSSNTAQQPEKVIPVEKLPLNQKFPGSASSDKGSLLSGGMLSLPPSDTMKPPHQSIPVEKLPLKQKFPDQGLPAAGQKLSNNIPSSSVDILSGGVLSFPIDNNDPNAPGQGFSNQLPPSVDFPLVDNKPKLQNKPAAKNLDLPSNPSIQDLNKGMAFPDQQLPSLGNQNFGIAVQNMGNANLKPDVIDSNVLFPVAEVLPSAKDTQNNDFLMNFFPTFPTGEEIVNLNNGGFVQELGQPGFLPAQDVLPGGSTGILPGKSDRLPVESFKPKQTFPSDLPVKPDIHKPTVNKINKPDIHKPHKPTMDKTKHLPVLEPIPMDQFQPADLSKAPINQFNPEKSGMVPVGHFTAMGSEKVRQIPFKDPLDEIVPVDQSRFPGPFSGGDPGRVPADQFIPMDSGRPISMVPLDAMKQEPIPDLHPMKEPALDMMRPGGVVALGKPKPRASHRIDKPVAPVAQDVLPKKKPEVGDRRADQIMAKWIALYPEGRRPEKMKPVKIGEVHEIAPPTPDQALLSQISLVNYGKDKAMRRMLREQRKQARKRQRRLRKQRRQQRLQQNNVGNQRLPTQGGRNNRNVRNNRNRRQRKRDINPGVVMGMGRGRKKRRRSKRQAIPWQPKEFRKQQKKERKQMKLQREFQNRFPHLQGNPVGSQGSVVAGINEASGLPDLKSKKRQKPKSLKKWLNEGHATTEAQPGTLLSELHVTEQIKLEAAKHLGNGKQKSKWKKRGRKMRPAGRFSDVTINSVGSTPQELHVTEQIKLEAAKHLGNGKLKGRGKKRGMKMKPAKRFRDISIDSVDTQPSELHVTDQIKLEAAKQLGTGKFKKQGKKRGKKMRPSKRFRDVHIDSVGSVSSDLHVTEQIKLEAAKQLGDGKLKRRGKNRGRKMKPAKRFTDVPIDSVGSLSSELHVAEQIKIEAAKHLGNGNLNRQGKKRGKKVKPAKRFRDVPIDSVGSMSDLHVTEQIKIEATKQLGNGKPKRKGKKRLPPLLQRLRSGKREKKRPARKFFDISINDLGTGQPSTVEQRTVRNMPIDIIGAVDPGLPDLFTGKKIRKQKGNKRKKLRKGNKRVPLLQRLRSGKKEKKRPARKFVDVSLQDAGINQASTAEQKTVKVPSIQGPASRSSSTEMVAGLGLIDWSVPFEDIVALKRKRRNVLNSFTHLLQGSRHRSIETAVKNF